MGDGNVQKMREALVMCVQDMCRYCRAEARACGLPRQCLDGCETLKMAKAALSAPPRNCDKYDHRYWVDEFEKQMGKAPSKTADEQDEYMKENWFLFYHWLSNMAEGKEASNG